MTPLLIVFYLFFFFFLITPINFQEFSPSNLISLSLSLIAGLHSPNVSSPKNGAFGLVSNTTLSKEVVVAENKSSKRMNMNCFSNVPARVVLYFLSWSGFLVSFMMRNDINFAIVVMARTNGTQTNTTVNSTESLVSFEKIFRNFWEIKLKISRWRQATNSLNSIGILVSAAWF